VFLDAHLRVQRHTFGQVADVAANVHGLGHHVEAGDAGDAAGGRQVTGEDAQGRGLAGSVRAEKADDLTFLDVKGDVRDGLDRAEVLGEPFDLDHGTILWVRLRGKAARGGTAPGGGTSRT